MDELPPIVETDTSSLAYGGRDAEYISGYEAGFVKGEEYMQEKMRAYAAAAVAREREKIIALADHIEAQDEKIRVLREALEKVLPWVVTQEVACNGMKCREAVCMSCSGESESNAQLACDAYAFACGVLAVTQQEKEK